LHGLGLIQVPRYSVEQDLADGTLVECLPDTPPSPTSVYVLYPRSRQLSLRVRVFIDWVTEEYAGHIGPMATADIACSSHLLAK
jgi:DNA-binding transcriptional LysR family regulator